MKKNLFIISLFFCSFNFLAQNKLLDSLWSAYKKPGQADTSRLKTFAIITHNYAFVKPDSGVILSMMLIKEAKQKKIIRAEGIGYNTLGINYMYLDSTAKAIDAFNTCYTIGEKLKDKGKMAAALLNIGLVYGNLGDHARALEYSLKSLKLREEAGDKKALGNSYANLGIAYAALYNYPKAIEFYLKSLKIAEQTGNKELMANNYNNTGLIYRNMKNLSKAIEYYFKSLKIKEEIGNKRGMASSLTNIGAIYYDQRNYLKANEYYLKSLKIQQETGNRRGIASSMGNLGAYYQDLPDSLLKKMDLTKSGKYEKALEYHFKALKIHEEIADKHGIAYDLDNIGTAYLGMGKLKEAEKTANNALIMARELGEPDREEHLLETLSEVYNKQGKMGQAFILFKKHIILRDSLQNEEKNKDITRKEMQYEYDKKTTADSVKNSEERKVKDAEITAQQSQLKQEKTQRFALYGGLMLVCIFAIFAYNRFKITQKQKHIIELQKNLVEEKQKEIIDSIHYAKRIQTSLLTSQKYIERNLQRLNKL